MLKFRTMLVQVFLTADAAVSYACTCTEIKNAKGAELPVEHRLGCISQFSVNSDEVVEFPLNVFSTMYCDKTLLITLNGNRSPHSMLAKFLFFWAGGGEVGGGGGGLRAFCHHPHRYLQMLFFSK